jgi:serine protease Do
MYAGRLLLDARLCPAMLPHGRRSLYMLPLIRPFAAKLRPFSLALLTLVLCAGLASADRRTRDEVPPVFEKALPEGVQDLKAIQDHVKKIVDRVMPSTVGLQIGQAQGSGVIIDKEGHILTAAHVSGKAGRPVQIILHDGRKLKGVTLGADVGIDSGLIQITDEDVDFPYVGTGRSADLKKGQWVIALGHPGGYQKGRPPVVRVGRVLEATARLLRTDCTLVGGDSGGPLFDMNGKVVGIHSRIGPSITYNIHVPADTYADTWERLAASEVWGSPFNILGFGKLGQPFLGVRPDPDSKPFKILAVTPDSPAAKAGLRVDDIILKIDDREVRTISEFDAALRTRQPGNQISLEFRRGSEQMSVTVTLAKRLAE